MSKKMTEDLTRWVQLQKLATNMLLPIIEINSVSVCYSDNKLVIGTFKPQIISGR